MKRRTSQYGRQSIDKDDISAVLGALNSERITQGHTVKYFEEALSASCSVKHAISCNSGTAALLIAYRALRIGVGDSVIVPAITFAATANAVLMSGAEVIFCDCDPDTGLIDLKHLTKLLRKYRTVRNIKAVTVVHIAGQPCDMKRVYNIASNFEIEIIEDACHAIGSYYCHNPKKNLPVGSCEYSAISTFSFHPVKTITTAEGGAITTNSDELSHRIRKLVSHGIVRWPEKNLSSNNSSKTNLTKRPWYYEIEELSGNYRMSDINAALGVSQLKKLPKFARMRHKLWLRYAERLSKVDLPIGFIRSDQPDLVCWHLFVALIDFEKLEIERSDLMNKLASCDIGTQVHYIPVYQHPLYKKRYGESYLPGSECYYERCLSLPLHTAMKPNDVDYVVDCLIGLISA